MRRYPIYPKWLRKPSRGARRAPRRRSFLATLDRPRVALLGVAIGVGVGLAGASLGADGLYKLASYAGLNLVSPCNVKGNIAVSSGERIYHVPGQEYYPATRISPLKGERYFCSEAEAREAGWRRALGR